MTAIRPDQGISTIVNHYAEGENPYHAHTPPIYQTSTFGFPNVEAGAEIVSGERPGYYYTRLGNPNLDQTAQKIAYLEALDLLNAHPEVEPQRAAQGRLFASGMAAVAAAVLSQVSSGDTILAQQSLYSNTFTIFQEFAPRLGIKVVWLRDPTTEQWEQAFRQNPQAKIAYAETPANPSMQVVDLRAVAQLAHEYGAWLVVDNTFATPYCQRPLTLGADVVIHSTTKYLSGHGVVVGGAVVSSHLDYMQKDLKTTLKTLGGTPGPFDAWLTNLGLKTFELRMLRHCENAMQVARYLQGHPKVAQVFYPGLEDHPGYAIACQQMHNFGGMLSFELKDGLKAGENLMNQLRIITLAVSLGMVDSVIQHPASMTHAGVAREERLNMGISDGLVRFSVGIENVDDLLEDLEQGLAAA